MTPAQVEDAVRVDPEEWATELASIEEWFANFGDSLPEALRAELDGLKARLAASSQALAGRTESQRRRPRTFSSIGAGPPSSFRVRCSDNVPF